MANKTLQISRNKELFSSKVSAKNALKRLMNNAAPPPQDGEIRAVRYTDEDGYERTLLGAYKMNGEGISYVSILEPEDVRTSDNRIYFTVSGLGENEEITIYTYDDANHKTFHKTTINADGEYILTDAHNTLKGSIIVNTLNYGFRIYVPYDTAPITSIDISEWDSSNVTVMSSFLFFCKNLASVDLTPLDTSNVTDMSYFLSGCTGLTSIDLKPLNTSKATNMNHFLSGCTGLTSIDLSPLDTSSVKYMVSFLSGCTGLTSIDLSPLSESKTTTLAYFLSGCTGLTSIDLSPLDTSSVTHVKGFLSGCTRLTEIDLSPIDTGKSTNLSYFLCNCTSLVSATGDIDMSSATVLYDVDNPAVSKFLYNCSKLTTISIANFGTPKDGLTLELKTVPLSEESIVYLFTNAADRTGYSNTATISISATTVSNMGSNYDTDIAIATAKGYTITT